MIIETDIHPHYIDHFRSQLLYVEIFNDEIKILFDGGGYQDRHHLMIELLKRSFSDYPLNKKIRCWLFTGDNRPTNHVNNEPLFSISGSRILQDFVIPDPYSIKWPYAKIDDFYEYSEKIKNESIKRSITPKIMWRGSKHVNPNRKLIVESLESANQEMLDIKHVDDNNKHEFVEMIDLLNSAVLLELPGRGFSARMKYLLHAYRPLLVVERIEWDHATMNLEPGLHYVLTQPDLKLILIHLKKILENYDHFYQMSIQSSNVIFEIMKRKNISRALTEKLKKYV